MRMGVGSRVRYCYIYILPPNNDSETRDTNGRLVVVVELHKETLHGQESVNAQYTVVGVIKNSPIYMNWACAEQDAVYHFSQSKGQPRIVSYTNLRYAVGQQKKKTFKRTIHLDRNAIIENKKNIHNTK